MAQTIKIKRSTTAASPSELSAGELAYSDNSDKLFIGAPADNAVIAIGGKLYVDMLDHVAGTLTESSAVIVDADSKINKLLTGNIRINNTANHIDTSSGNLTLNPAGNLVLTTGTVDISAQATEFKLLDNSATAFTISEGDNNYITLATTNTAELIIFNKHLQFGDLTASGYKLPITDGTAGQALVTNGSGVVTFTDVAATLTVDADSTSKDVALLTDDLEILGGEGIDTVIAKVGNDVTLTISGEDASASNKGIASFDSTHFTASSGAITANDITLTSDSGDAAATIGETFTFTGGEGIDTSAAGTTVTITGEDASTTNKGIASFDSTDFTVSSGAVSVNTITLGSSDLDPGETTSTLAGLEQLDVDHVRVDGNTISTTDTNGNLVLAPDGSGTVTVPTGYKGRAGFGATSLVTKEYVDALKQALDVKDSVTVATTANLPATYNNTGGTLTNNSGTNAALELDGITVVAENRILVKNQTNEAHNGIYVVTTAGDNSTAWVLTRAEDADASAEMTGGVFTFVEQGAIGAENGYVFTHNGAPTLGTTDLTVSQFSGAGQIVAGDALSKSGNQIDLNDDNITLEVASDSVRIKGISSTAIGDLLIGAAGSNTGYTRLVKPSPANITAGSFVVGETYTITAAGNTNFTTVGAADSSIGTVFTATAAGTGTGTASSSNPILSINAAGVASWASALDGGRF